MGVLVCVKVGIREVGDESLKDVLAGFLKSKDSINLQT